MRRFLLFTAFALFAWTGAACAAVMNLVANTGRLCLAAIFAPIALLMGAPVLVAVATAGLIGAVVFAMSGPILAPKPAPAPVQSALSWAFWIAVLIGGGLLAIYERRRLLSVAKRVVRIARKGAPGGPAARDN